MPLSRPPGGADDDGRPVDGPTAARASGAMSPSASIAFPTLRDLPAAPPGPGFSRSPGTAPGHVLAPGTRLRDYEITGLIGEGGFGIVYLALDHSLQRKVAIKEYMPASMASRVAGSSAIVIQSERHLDPFKAGLKSFVNEARLLARFDHPSLVKVYRFWEENGTAYMVMPFYEGPTLKTALAELGHVPSEAELRTWLEPLLDALTVMHAARCFHRDIAPDNILLTPTGPLLLDFGAARRVIGDMTHALTVVLKPGYAPIEQYGDVASMAQGAWTDLYALACVVYYAITGRTPMSSVERLMDDRLEPIAVEARGRYSDAFLRAIDRALAVRPSERPQNESEFRALLDAGRDRAAAGSASAPISGSLQLRASLDEIPDRVVTAVPRQLVPMLATEIFVRPPEATGDGPMAAPVVTEPEREPSPDRAAAPLEPTMLLPRRASPAPEPGAEPATNLQPSDPAPAPTQAADATLPDPAAFAPTMLQPRERATPAEEIAGAVASPARSVAPVSPAETPEPDTPPQLPTPVPVPVPAQEPPAPAPTPAPAPAPAPIPATGFVHSTPAALPAATSALQRALDVQAPESQAQPQTQDVPPVADSGRRGTVATIGGTLAVVAIGAIAAWAWRQPVTADPAPARPPSVSRAASGMVSPAPAAPSAIGLPAARSGVASPSISPSPLPSPASASASASSSALPSRPDPATAAHSFLPTPTRAAAAASSATAPATSMTSPTMIASPSPGKPATALAAPRPRRDTPARPQPPPDTDRDVTAPPHRAPSSARCSDILQKASLEPLTAEEAAYLKRECR